MSKLEDLVPPLELCKQIPDEMFDDSALIWWNGTVYERYHAGPYKAVPAPTLQEIMNYLPDATVYKLGNRYCAGIINSSDDGISEYSAVVSAMKLWLEVKQNAD